MLACFDPCWKALGARKLRNRFSSGVNDLAKIAVCRSRTVLSNVDGEDWHSVFYIRVCGVWRVSLEILKIQLVMILGNLSVDLALMILKDLLQPQLERWFCEIGVISESLLRRKLSVPYEIFVSFFQHIFFIYILLSIWIKTIVSFLVSVFMSRMWSD